MSNNDVISVHLGKERETKGTVLYTTSAHDAPISNVYIVKNHLPTPYPESVIVNIEIEPMQASGTG